MKHITLSVLLGVLLLGSCGKRQTYDTLGDGVVIHVSDTTGGTKLVRLQVVSKDIIHVTATAVDSFSTAKSLIVLPGPEKPVSWKATEGGGQVTVTTSALQARVSLSTGEVIFADSTGRIILQEQEGGGKTFTASAPAGDKGYQVRQVFDSPADEAFYGLGGHQNGQMNYKGQDVELVQQNIVDVVPFLYSSRNYGILWDNYSISRFGDPREYQPLNSLNLFTKDGKPGGLTADYYVGNKIKTSATEDKIDYEYLETPQVDSFPKDVAANGKVVWEGSFTSDKEGAHKFLVYAAGYFKVWVDGKLLMDKWRQGWNPWTSKFTTDVKKGEKHTIKIEWMPDGGAYIAVKHLDPIAAAEQVKLSLWSELGDEINYYFIQGKDADAVIHGYRELTGKAPIIPKWALGFWQSRERYRNAEELVGVVKEYRKRGIPLDNIVMDWQYWEDPKWGSHEFDLKRFPDPQGMLNTLHKDLHANFMISVWPKFNKGTGHYDAMREKGYLYMHNIEKQRKDWVGVGYESTFYDPFSPGASELFWQQIDTKLNSLGVDGWWLDATEPDIHSNLSIEERKINFKPNGKDQGTRYFNAYSLLNAKGVYEGQRKSSPEKRVFILTRSAFAGQQRYSAVTWSGDIVSRWSDLKDQLATGVNFSLSGIPYWTMDIGGFAVEKRYEHATGATLDEWRELNTRWFQYGTFCPVFRSHGQYPFREIYNISPEGNEAYTSMVYYDRLRYRLMPYIYSLAGWSYFNDYTIMRGLVMDFNNDAKVRDIADQYMFGPSLLINPVYEYKARSRRVYLPGTGWYDLYTGKYYDGGQSITADAPYGRMPVFVKAGAILPAGPVMQYTGEKATDPITLYVYAGANGSFELYEDEGTNYKYEYGRKATILFTYNDGTHTLTIGKREGSFEGMAATRSFQIVWVKKDRAAGVSEDVHADQTVAYTGEAVEVQLK